MTAHARVRWLDTRPLPGARSSTNWGIPWRRGDVPAGTAFTLRDADGTAHPLDSWVTATWPDGSIKWSAHSATLPPSDGFTIQPGDEVVATECNDIAFENGGIVVDTGIIRATIPAHGDVLIRTLERDGKTIAESGRLVSELSSTDDGYSRSSFASRTVSAEVEHDTGTRTVILITGHHTDGTRSWLPFRVRLEFHRGSDRIGMTHTFAWNGDPERDFLCALGIRFGVPLSGPLHDRHVRIAGSTGFLSESARPVTGLWRDPGDDVRAFQTQGRRTPPTDEWDTPDTYLEPAPAWDERLEHVPAWNDWTLTQLSPDGYTVRKRTGPGHGWVTVPSGTRAQGYVYLGSPDGGLEMGLRDFWKACPTQIDVKDVARDRGQLTMWLYAPQAQPMDMRFYHAGEHEQDADGQLAALEVTYEDYKPGFGNAHGIARTHQLSLRIADATPSHDELAQNAIECATPPLLVASPEHLHRTQVFGPWAPAGTNAEHAEIEARLRDLVEYYIDQVEERRWYGFWDYGDVMHSYDADRHTWRYDIGGYAWDNSELSTDQWLWVQYLRTGDARTFRLAEAMTRHTGEVDVYHHGEFAGFGTRHNVQHWGCSCKQLRVSNPLYRRYFYFLTADERTGELMDEIAIDERLLTQLDVNRMVGARGPSRPSDASSIEVDLGIDFGAIIANWLTRWERHGDTAARDALIHTLEDIAAMPRRFFTGIAHLDARTLRFDTTENRERIDHLSAVFGIFETLDEVLDLVDVPAFEQAWREYCRLYLADADEQLTVLSTPWDGPLKVAHSRLLAWAAHRSGDAEGVRRAWEVFTGGPADRMNLNAMGARRSIDGPCVAEAVSELVGVTTNDAAQYSLAAIAHLALAARYGATA